MTSDHTPEPWKVDNVTRDRVKILGPDRPHRQAGRDGMPADLVNNTAIAHMFCPNETEQAANAARIVACVNAFAGIPTEQLGDVARALDTLKEIDRCASQSLDDKALGPDADWRIAGSLMQRVRDALAPFLRKD